MTFKPDEGRIRELAQIEAEANCAIGAGGSHRVKSDAIVALEERAKRGSLQDLKQILAKVPNIEPEEFDKF
jgi:hypothetical protein